MPLYELFVISAEPALDGLKKSMMSTGRILLDRGLPIRKIIFMGQRQLPYKMKIDRSQSVTQGNYWAMYFYAGTSQIKSLRSDISECKDIVRSMILKRATTLKYMTYPLS